MSKMGFITEILQSVEAEWLPLADVTRYEQPTKYLVDSKNYSDEFNTPVVTAGKTFILGYTNEVKGIYRASACPVIIFDDFTTNTQWVDFDFKAKSSAMKMITSKDECKVLLKYIYYWLKTLPNEVIEGDHKRQWISNFCNKRIPIPCPEDPAKSLAIQTEIVRILDTFTALNAELAAELTAEMINRRKQYNYYRDQLLNFGKGEAAWKTLGEIGEFIRGKRFTKADYVEVGISVIHYGEIYTRYGVFTTTAYSHVRHDMAESLRYAEPGDVVITDVGETVEDVGKAVAWLGEDKVAIHDHCYAFRHSMNPKFVSYCMQTTSFIAEKAKYVARTKVNTLLINGFSKISIPVPYPEDRNKSLAEQARIVSILDKFDASSNSISKDLAHEIALRQKQYDNYRNLLFSLFKSGEVVA